MNENHILSIFNYCDRWCERCRFVERCALGSNQQLEDLELQMALAETEEEETQLTVNYLHDTFSNLHKMLHDDAEKMGIDLEAAMEEAANNPEPEAEPSQSQKDLEALAHHYADVTHDWMKENRLFFQPEQVMSALMTHPGDPEQVAEGVKEAFETLQWFMFMLAVKVNRALSGVIETYQEEGPLQSDWNGSAKVALLGTERCIAAWETLQHVFPDLEDGILSNLAVLDKLKRGILTEFPRAMEFVRPGFDEAEYAEVGR